MVKRPASAMSNSLKTMSLLTADNHKKGSVDFLLNKNDTIIPQSSGLPTPVTSPEQIVQHDINSSRHLVSPANPIDPTVVLGSETTGTSQSPLFATQGSETSRPESTVSSPAGSPASTASEQAPVSAEQIYRGSTNRSDTARSSWSKDTVKAFARRGPSRIWLGERVAESLSSNIVFTSRAWAEAVRHPNNYIQGVIDSNATYQSGLCPGLNLLSEVAATRIPLMNITPPQAGISQSSTTRRRRATTTNIANAESTANSAQGRSVPTPRRAAPKKRAHTEDSGPEAKRARAPAVKKPKYDSYEDVDNYCPSIDILPEAVSNRGKFKTSWESKSAKLDLAADKNQNLIGTELSRTEAEFAATHQLDINKYLINKRKIFEGYVARLATGIVAFGKTNAQGAAVMDVNKASRLWEFYQAVGWFNPTKYDDQINLWRSNQAGRAALTSTATE